ncbi:hypothetical protein [Clostridium fungisolvens]|uniref:Uncharacterized protein n=1 Tax=Clostridium fungisolvens TaxID=1604897 RepID=A0A6V8SHS6_9CLOT|nr:hypothetical protein [Clostridium fungisolvens]GFP76286.1 hypothetical protein bsdtw1_02388 [Clostridium fungisolvens]
MAVLIKPCFIYDMLCYAGQRFFELGEYYLEEQKDLIYKTNKELEKYSIEDFNRNGPSMSSMCMVLSCLTDNKDIEKLTIKDLIEIINHPENLSPVVNERLKDNDFLLKDVKYTIKWLEEGGSAGYVKLLEALDKINFYETWIDEALPRAKEECVKLNNKIGQYNLDNIFGDILKLRNEDRIDDVNIFVSFFSHPVCFSLYNKSFLSSCLSDFVDGKMFVQIIAHELMHGFSNNERINILRELINKDDFLKKTYNTLVEKYSGAEEEQFVVAAEYYLAVINGLSTYDEIIETAKQRYGGCMPLSLIIFKLLIQEKSAPINYNLWLSQKFNSGCLNGNSIEKQVEEIAPGFVNCYEQSLAN